MTTWKCFKSFHLSYNILFPEFPLLSITSFISFLNSIKGLQVSSIKSYISGIQFFHKLLYGAPSPEISNSQTTTMIRGMTILNSETISFLVKQSKTDQVKKGHFVYIFNLSSPIQPYQAIHEYLRLRIFQAKSPLEPLFLDHTNKPASRAWFQKHLRSVLLSAGISAKKFSSHSFRIGAATSAAQKGLTKHQIQTLGRWSSEAFQSYI